MGATSAGASPSESSSGSPGLRRLGVGVLWLLTVLETAGMGLSGAAKFMGTVWIEMFASWGYPAWFAFFIGGLELVCALLLLVPRLTAYAAIVLLVVMLGALFTELTKESLLGPTMPLVHLGVLGILLAARWNRRWRPS